jgi:hypothetical protein
VANKLKAMADVAANEAHEADRTSVAIKANEAYNAEANDDTKAIMADGVHEADEIVKADEVADKEADKTNNVDEAEKAKAIKADKANSTSGCCKIARLISQ